MSPSTNLKPVALVTGGTGAIGAAICEGLARREFNVVIVARNPAKGERVAGAIADRVGVTPKVVRCDVSSKGEVLALAAEWKGPLHVLVNNAAECPRRRTETSDGIEGQLATNVLGYFWMIRAFEPVLAASAPARVVNVASYWAGGLDLDDLEFRRRRYDNDAAYRQSKQADRMLTAAFAEKLKDKHITVNACHPGDVPSNLSHSLGFGGHETPEQGAATPLYLATEEIGGAVTGRYFAHLREEPCRFMEDKKAVQRLFEIFCNY